MPKKAILQSSLGAYLLKFIGLLSTVIIARLLTPEEIGLFAMAGAAVVIFNEIRAMGAGIYLIREERLTEQKIRTALGVTIIFSWLFFLALVVFAPYVAMFYGQEPVRWIIYIIAIAFIPAPFVVVAHSLLTRKMEFGILSRIRVITAILSLFMTIVMVSIGWSYYALAIAQPLSMALQLIFFKIEKKENVLYVRPSFWGGKKVISLGIFTTVSNLSYRYQFIITDVILGKLGTPTQVAIYSRGLGLIDFVQQTLLMGVRPVIMPYFSTKKKEEGLNLNPYYMSSMMICSIIWPSLLFLYMMAEPLVILMFGNQWLDSIPVARILVIWAFITTFHVFSAQLFLSRSLEKMLCAKDVTVFVIYLLLIYNFYAEDLTVVAKAFVLGGAVDFLLTTLLLKFKTQYKIYKSIMSMIPAVIISIVTFGTLKILLMTGFFSIMELPNFVYLMVAGVLFSVIWVFVAGVIRHPLYFAIKSYIL